MGRLWPPATTSSPSSFMSSLPLIRQFSPPSSSLFPQKQQPRISRNGQCCFNASTAAMSTVPPMVKKKKKPTRYRKRHPGETEGITEEMRFVAMRLRNFKGKYLHKNPSSSGGKSSDSDISDEDEVGDDSGSSETSGTWIPSVEGFVNYLVDSKLVFDTIERVIDESDDVAYSYFRKTGLERAEAISKDLQWFREQGMSLPQPSDPGVTYAKYLEELAEKSAPLFLCHFYNIYFSHIAGGQVIVNQVSERVLEGRELEFCRWDGDANESLKGVREKLNALGEHWSRYAKKKCLKETAKAFQYMGQIVRLIIL